jgi:hypothetical protein
MGYIVVIRCGVVNCWVTGGVKDIFLGSVTGVP